MGGQVSKVVLLWVGALIYLVVGVWMLYDASQMPAEGGGAFEVRELCIHNVNNVERGYCDAMMWKCAVRGRGRRRLGGAEAMHKGLH